MKNEYDVIHVFDASDEKEFKEKINGIIRTLCTEDIEKMSNIDYNMDVAYLGGTSEFYKKEVSDGC